MPETPPNAPHAPVNAPARMKLAELTSGVGALILGVGLGALLPARVLREALVAVIIGALVHAFGMWDKHRLEADGARAQPAWVTGMYRLCWLLLAAGAIYFALVIVGRTT